MRYILLTTGPALVPKAQYISHNYHELTKIYHELTKIRLCHQFVGKSVDGTNNKGDGNGGS
jgi:hypothetical protein